MASGLSERACRAARFQRREWLAEAPREQAWRDPAPTRRGTVDRRRTAMAWVPRRRGQGIGSGDVAGLAAALSVRR